AERALQQQRPAHLLQAAAILVVGNGVVLLGHRLDRPAGHGNPGRDRPSATIEPPRTLWTSRIEDGDPPFGTAVGCLTTAANGRYDPIVGGAAMNLMRCTIVEQSGTISFIVDGEA